jgi:hypothetical protein
LSVFRTFARSAQLSGLRATPSEFIAEVQSPVVKRYV